MVDLRQTVSDHLGGLESLASKIPGYSGYKEKEMRREADSLLRQHLAGQLAEQLTNAEDIASQMLTGPGISQLDDMGKGNTRLQHRLGDGRVAATGLGHACNTNAALSTGLNDGLGITVQPLTVDLNPHAGPGFDAVRLDSS